MSLLLVGLAALAVGAALFNARSVVNGPRVMHRERAQGVHPSLIAFLDWWDAHGSFVVIVPDSSPPAGVRDDEEAQREAFLRGDSKAQTLADTPHGRGAALDLWPLAFNPHQAIDQSTYQLFGAIGVAAEARGLTWGGRWTKAFLPSAANPYGGDLPHVEVTGWRALSFPGGYA